MLLLVPSVVLAGVVNGNSDDRIHSHISFSFNRALSLACAAGKGTSASCFALRLLSVAEKRGPMKTFFAKRRANGDWFALDDDGLFRVPVFYSSGAAMLARSRDAGMECFRPVPLDDISFKNLTTTDEGKACFWLIEDPLMKLSRGRSLEGKDLARLMKSGAKEVEATAVAK